MKASSVQRSQSGENSTLVHFSVAITIYLRLDNFFFVRYLVGLELRPHLEPLHQPFFCDGFLFFEIGSCELFAQAGFEL
jgi:hypothetical protein